MDITQAFLADMGSRTSCWAKLKRWLAMLACLRSKPMSVCYGRSCSSVKRITFARDGLFRAALDLAETVEGWYLRGHGLWGIGKNLIIQEHYEEAMPRLDESSGIFENVGARLAIAMVWSEQAVCYLSMGQDEKAMELFRRAERVNFESEVVHNYQVVLANIANMHLHRRDHFTAISYYQRALALARDIKDPVSVKKWTRNINLAYARIRQSVDEQNPRTA